MPDSSSHHQSLWLSAGLFVVVAVASQVVQNRRRQQEREAEQIAHDYALGHRYSMKRMMHDRLSRENLSSLVEQELKARKGEVNMESVSI